MKSVVHIIDSKTPGDMVTQLLNLRLPGERIISLGLPPRLPAGTEITLLKMRLGLSYFATRELVKTIGSNEILHLWSTRYAEAVSRAAEIKNSRVVLSLPGLPVVKQLEKLSWILGSMRMTLTLPTSEGVNLLTNMRADPKLVATLPPSLPASTEEPLRDSIRRSLGVDQEDFLVTVPAEMIHNAGFKAAIWAFAVICGCRKNLKMALHGIGHLQQTFRSYANKTEFSNKIFFTDLKYSMNEILAAADISLCPFSQNIGMTAPVAAMAAGNIIITHKRGDLATICRNNETAIITETPESREMAATIQLIADFPADFSKISKNAQDFSQTHFNHKTVRARLDTIYESL